MPEQPQLDPIAIESTAKKLYNQYGKDNWNAEWEHLHPRIRAEYYDKVTELVSDYFAMVLPAVNPSPWTVTRLRANFEWGGSVRQDTAEFDRVLANVRAEALEKAADDSRMGPVAHGWNASGIASWLRARASQLRKETKTR